MNCLRSKDPLVLHDTDAPKSEAMRRGIAAVDGFVFRPSLLSFSWYLGGNGQTLMNMFKENFEKKVYGDYAYDKRETFILSDGGQILIHYKGELFTNDQDLGSKPLLFVMPGLSSHAQSGYVRNMVDIAYNQGYQVVLISYRGIGLKFTTPKVYCGYTIEDVSEPIKAIAAKYAKDGAGKKRKIFAVGASLGGTLLANCLGDLADEMPLDAACIVNTPLKVWQITDFLKASMNGGYNQHMARGMCKLIDANFEILEPYYKEKLGIDLKAAVDRVKEEKSQLLFDELITAPFYGRKGYYDLYKWVACYHRIPKIKVPTLLMCNLDDPILGEESIDYDIVKSNPNTLLATNSIGGHLGYHESLFSLDVWFMKPVLSFLESQK